MRKRFWVDVLRCNVTFEIPSHQERRLAGTCFRGRDLRRAGNFCRWEHADAMFDDEAFRARLFEQAARAIRGVDLRDPVTRSVTVGYPDPVGWAGTRPYNSAHVASYEEFAPNRHSVGLRVRRGEPILAPATLLVTLVIEFRKARDGLSAIIHTVYPGPDIGPLRPTEPGATEPVDITKRESVVFLDWNHDGEPLAS